MININYNSLKNNIVNNKNISNLNNKTNNKENISINKDEITINQKNEKVINTKKAREAFDNILKQFPPNESGKIAFDFICISVAMENQGKVLPEQIFSDNYDDGFSYVKFIKDMKSYCINEKNNYNFKSKDFIHFCDKFENEMKKLNCK